MSLLKFVWSSLTTSSHRGLHVTGSFLMLPVLYENVSPESIPREINRVQDILISKRYLCEHHKTGVFDTKTQDAIKAFQHDNDLVPDGIVSTLTWSALLYPRLSRLSQLTEVNKAAIYELQNNLFKIGFKYIQINGRFDLATERVVKQFQKNYGLQIDGVVGPMTMSTLLGQKHQPEFDSVQPKFPLLNVLAIRSLLPIAVLSLGIMVSPFKENLTILELFSYTYALVCIVPCISKRLSFQPSSAFLESSPYFLTGFMSPYILQLIKNWVFISLVK